MSDKSGKPTPLPRKTSSKTKQGSAHRDWLAEFAARAGLDDTALISVRDWIAEQFIGDEYAQLGHAGHGDTQIPLRQVFVDLPMGTHPSSSSDRPGETRPFLEELLGFEASLLRNFCDNRFLDRNDIETDEVLETSPPAGRARGGGAGSVRRNSASLERCDAAGTILIGGPGQGKSTLCQLLCQLHRFPLVAGDPRPQTTTIQDVLTPFQNVDPKSKLTPPSQPLLPIRIVLPDASTWLEKSPTVQDDSDTPILLKFISSQESSKKAQLAASTLAALMAHIPFLLVFDGFDEIGAENDRKRIIETIRELIAKFATRSSKAVIVATTRPQGYTGELEGIGVRLTTRYLVRLSTKEALHYAFKLLDAKIKGVDEREKKKDQLRAAAEEPATAKLLETPLQATILAALSEKGNVPTQRWRLFENYLRTMYDREIGRSIGASKLLEQRRSQIESIHARAALLLQVEAEASGGAASKMPRARFASIVDQVLQEEGVDAERPEVVESIVKVAENRLVLLVTPEPDVFGFEIRSLQEFMAAWALVVDTNENVVEHRIWQIAKAPLFRNVLLFIASKIYGGTSSLREYVAKTACAKLDEDASDALARTTKAGALLALEILEEGAVSSSTRFARELMVRATGLLDLPASELHPRLVRAVNKDTEKVFIEALEKRLTSESFLDSVTSWVCLLEATNTGLGKKADKPDDPSLAERLADSHWPKVRDPNAILEACRFADINPSDWIVAKINETPELFDPYWLISNLRFGRRRDVKSLASRLHGKASVVTKSMLRSERRLWLRRSMNLIKLASPFDQKSRKQELESVRDLSPQWRAWTSIVEFEESPSAAQLATTLSEIALNLSPSEWTRLSNRVSWPLQACLQAATSCEDLETMASASERLELGDHDDWTEAENKWTERPTVQDELLAAQKAKPFTRESIQVGPPIYCFPPTSWYGFSRPPIHVTMKEWWNVFAAVSKFNLDAARSPFLSDVVSAHLAAPKNPGWIHLIVAYIQDARTVPASLLSQLAKSLAKHTYSSVEARLQVTLLRIWLGNLPPSETDGVLKECVEHLDENFVTSANICKLLSLSAYPHATREQLLIQWFSLVRHDMAAATQAMRTLRREFHVRRSDLNNLTTWNDLLALPPPYPQARTTELAISPIPTKPIVLEKLHLQHVRGIHDLPLEFSPPPAGKGQWIVFLGRNGMGKTTLLKSLCLALRNLDDAKIWGDNIWTPPWREFGQDAAARIAIRIAGYEEERITTIHNGSQQHRQTRVHTPPRFFPLFAYGCRRGSALGGEAEAVHLKEESGPEIATLFDEGAGLVHAETWLKDWALYALQDAANAQPIYDAVLTALRKLLVIDDIFIKDRQVYVKEKSGRTIPFSAMSDGYLTTAGWFLDLIARWIELCKRAGLNIGSEFLKHMRGLVLIDEIDLHLHPSWQVEVIRRTRKLMPEMSFIVTTHNPLTLVGAKPEEIFKLKERAGRIVAERGQALPMLLTSSEIFSHYFDVDDVLPEGLGPKLQRYEFLSRYSLRNAAEHKEMLTLKAELAEEDIVPNWPEVERIVLPAENAPTTKTKLSRRSKSS